MKVNRWYDQRVIWIWNCNFNEDQIPILIKFDFIFSSILKIGINETTSSKKYIHNIDEEKDQSERVINSKSNEYEHFWNFLLHSKLIFNN